MTFCLVVLSYLIYRQTTLDTEQLGLMFLSIGNSCSKQLCGATMAEGKKNAVQGAMEMLWRDVAETGKNYGYAPKQLRRLTYLQYKLKLNSVNRLTGAIIRFSGNQARNNLISQRQGFIGKSNKSAIGYDIAGFDQTSVFSAVQRIGYRGTMSR